METETFKNKFDSRQFSDDLDAILTINGRIATEDFIYDFSNDKQGVALIFNHELFNDVNISERNGTKKDGADLKKVLENLQFEVRYHMDMKLRDIKQILYKLAKEDHSNNDCLLVAVMSHGAEDGQIFAKDKSYNVQELWENFLGNNCASLIGKPKMFFIQACRGTRIDPVVALKSKQISKKFDSVKVDSTEPMSFIPNQADLLVMYSTAEGYHAFRNTIKGSWFIQALCEELRANPHDEIMHILTRVNRKVAFEMEANIRSLNGIKQMPNIVSMLTKSFFLVRKTENDLCEDSSERYDLSNPNRGVALIFNHESFNDVNISERNGTKKDGDDLIKVLENLQFEVRYHMDMKLRDIKEILYKLALEDHSNNDCLLVAVMSHGAEDGEIFSKDQSYNVQELWENFLGNNCASLIGKPKFFFIQADRGAKMDPGVIFEYKKTSNFVDSEEVDSAKPIRLIPKLADLLVMYSTVENHCSIRKEIFGSWFIQALCEELKTDSHDDVITILTRVNRKVAFQKDKSIENNSDKQMPKLLSMLTKKLYFANSFK